MALFKTNVRDLRGIQSEPVKPVQQPEPDKDYALKIVHEKVKEIHPEFNEKQVDKLTHALLDKNTKDGKVNIDGQEIDIVPLSFRVAESIQIINSETSPEQEYTRMIDEGIDVIKKMTDGDITDQDIELREGFIDQINQREIEVKTCISLYRNAMMYGSPKVQEQARAKLEFLQMKWAKMLELRAAVQNSTKDKAAALRERTVTEQERDEAKLYIMALYYMKDNKHIPDRMKAKLGLMNGVVFDYSISEDFIKSVNKGPTTKSAVMDRINALRGRQDPNYRPKLLVEKQNFNSARFIQLKRAQELSLQRA